MYTCLPAYALQAAVALDKQAMLPSISSNLRIATRLPTYTLLLPVT
jgi:hypothetical protein